jgi:hypothetical protein
MVLVCTFSPFNAFILFLGQGIWEQEFSGKEFRQEPPTFNKGGGMEWTRGRREFGSSPTGIFLRVGNVADNFSSEVNCALVHLSFLQIQVSEFSLIISRISTPHLTPLSLCLRRNQIDSWVVWRLSEPWTRGRWPSLCFLIGDFSNSGNAVVLQLRRPLHSFLFHIEKERKKKCFPCISSVR